MRSDGFTAPKFFRSLTLVVLPLTLCPVAAQNLIKNGNFEETVVPAPLQWISYQSGQNLGGWLVTQGDVDIVSPRWTWQSIPSQALDLNGTMPGGIQQQIDTQAGEIYKLTFSFLPNMSPGGKVEYHAEVLWDGAQITEWSRAYAPFPTYETTSLLVTATGKDTLEFRSLGGETASFFIDNIILIPEPSIIALTAIGVISLFRLSCAKQSRIRHRWP